MKLPTKVYIINLPEDTEKLFRLLNRLKTLNISCIEVIEAIRGSSLDLEQRQKLYDDNSMRSNAGRSMTLGELGCALSHLSCYESLLSSEDAWSLILEDDAELPDELESLLPELIKQAVKLGVDVFSLGPVRKFFYSKYPKILSYNIIEPVRMWNAHAYLVNREAARAMLKVNRPVRYMADDWVSYQRWAKIRIKALDPFPCRQAFDFKLTGLERDRKFARTKVNFFSQYRFKYNLSKFYKRLVEIKKSFGRSIYGH